MNIVRSCGMLAAFAIVALWLVHIRAQQTRSASSILKIESDWVIARKELWSVRTKTARLRAPKRIRDRIERFDPDMIPPGMDGLPPRSQGVIASRFQ